MASGESENNRLIIPTLDELCDKVLIKFQSIKLVNISTDDRVVFNPYGPDYAVWDVVDEILASGADGYDLFTKLFTSTDTKFDQLPDYLIGSDFGILQSCQTIL